MGLKSAKEKLLSFATSFDSDVVGVGQTPPTIISPKPSGDLVLSDTKNLNKDPGNKSDAEILKNTDVTLADLKIESNRIVPYATSHIFNHDIDAMKDLLNARKMSHQFQDLILEKLYQITAGTPDGIKILEALDQVDTEVEDMGTLLSAIEGMVTSIENVNSSLEKKNLDNILTKNFTEILENINIIKEGEDNSVSPISIYDVVSDITSIPKNEISEFTSTGLYAQALLDADWSLRYGITPNFIIPANQRHPATGKGYSRMSGAYKKFMGSLPKTLKSLGIGDNASYEGVFKSSATKKVPIIDNFTPMQSVAYYCSVLSNEYLLSAGIGREVGTPLGQRFNAGGDTLNKLFGVKQHGNVTTSLEPGSLADFMIVDEKGNISVSSSLLNKNKKVKFLEGEDLNEEWYLSSKEAWLDTVKKDPLKNKVSLFDDILEAAVNTFGEAETYLQSILGQDTELSLLTPAGLFARVIKDFATLLEGLTVSTDQDLRIKNAVEIMLLMHSARGSSTLGTEVYTLRKRMHIFACRLSHLRRLSEEEEDATNRVRLTSLEGTSKFDGWIQELKGDKFDTALSLMPLVQTSESLTSGTTVKVTGQQIIDSVADNIEDNGLNSMMVSIFEDLQLEAEELASQGDDQKTYLREGNTTRFSGFDGAITIAYIYECFSIMAQTFCSTQFSLNPGMGFFAGLWFMDPEANSETKPALVKSFMESKQNIKFQGSSSSTSKLNQTRKFLLELSSALENNDFSNLVDADGDIGAVQGLKDTHNLGNGVNVTPSSLIDISSEMSKISDIPIQNFAVAKSMILSLKSSTQNLSVTAKALRGDTKDVPSDISILKVLGESEIGQKFINGLTTSQLDHAKLRLSSIAKSEDAPYRVDKIPPEIFDCMQFLLDVKNNEFTHSAILFLGLPSGLIAKEALQKGVPASQSSLRFSIDKISEIYPQADYEPIERLFSLKYKVRETLIVESFEAEIPPTNFNELVLLLTYDVDGEDEPVLGSEIIGQSNQPTETREHLQNTLESYLFKKMFEIIEGLTLKEEKIQLNSLETRGNGTKTLLSALINPLSVNTEFIETFFKEVEEGVQLPTSTRYEKMIQPQKVVVQGIDGWKNPITTPSQIDTAYSLFSTKPFFVEKVSEIVLSRSVFDDIFAVMVNLDEFELDTTSSTLAFFSQNNKNISTQDYINMIVNSKSPDRLSIESLYVSAELEEQ